MVKKGVQRLTDMQLSDGGWGWFSGYGERSSAHTTATVVHGLQVAVENDVAIVPNVLNKGVTWLENYRANQLELLKRGDQIRVLQEQLKTADKDNKETLEDMITALQKQRYKMAADNLDAFVEMVLVDANKPIAKMRNYLYRDRTKLSVYSLAMFGLSLTKQGHKEQLEMVLRNIDQYLVQDDENQTAYLKMPAGYSWWYWHGNEIEANGLLPQTARQD